MSRLTIVIPDAPSDHGLEFSEIPGVEEERAILSFEALVEALDLPVVARPAKGVGGPHIVVQEQLGGPCVAREDTVLVVMDDLGLRGVARAGGVSAAPASTLPARAR